MNLAGNMSCKLLMVGLVMIHDLCRVVKLEKGRNVRSVLL